MAPSLHLVELIPALTQAAAKTNKRERALPPIVGGAWRAPEDWWRAIANPASLAALVAVFNQTTQALLGAQAAEHI